MVKTILCSLIALWLTACASGGKTHYIDETSREAEGDYHPATGVNDRFNVRREVPDRSGPDTVPFYFKQCSFETGDFYNTRTRYDCNYP